MSDPGIEAIVFDFLGVLAHYKMRLEGSSPYQLVDDPEVIDAVIRTKRANVATGLVSNNDRDALLREAADLRLEELFDAMVFASDVARPKPHGDMFERIIAELGVEPGKCLFLDDSAQNVDAAIRIGMIGVVADSTKTIVESVDEVLYSKETSANSRLPRRNIK